MPQENGNVTNNVTPGGQNNPQNKLVQQGTTQPVNVDYDRMAEAIEKRSNSFMKTYLKEQGLSETEMQEAIKTFKDNKAKSSIDVQNNLTTLQNQLNEKDSKYQKLQLESEAYKQAISLKVDEKTIPYLIKMADFKDCFDEKGDITPDKVKDALNQVLTDVPTLKTNENESKSGVQVGADSSTQVQPNGNMFGFNFAGVRKH